MELKYDKVHLTFFGLLGSNRTFMELKSFQSGLLGKKRMF